MKQDCCRTEHLLANGLVRPDHRLQHSRVGRDHGRGSPDPSRAISVNAGTPTVTYFTLDPSKPRVEQLEVAVHRGKRPNASGSPQHGSSEAQTGSRSCSKSQDPSKLLFLRMTDHHQVARKHTGRCRVEHMLAGSLA